MCIRHLFILHEKIWAMYEMLYIWYFLHSIKSNIRDVILIFHYNIRTLYRQTTVTNLLNSTFIDIFNSSLSNIDLSFLWIHKKYRFHSNVPIECILFAYCVGNILSYWVEKFPRVIDFSSKHTKGSIYIVVPKTSCPCAGIWKNKS